MTIDRPLLGIMLMLGFCVLAPVGDAVAKILGQKFSHVRLNIYPDGGVSRLRVFGLADWDYS